MPHVVSITRTVRSMGSFCVVVEIALRDGSLGRRSSIILRCLHQEFEYSRVHDVVSARTHVMAAARYEFALEIRNQPTRTLERLSRIRDDFVIADEQ